MSVCNIMTIYYKTNILQKINYVITTYKILSCKSAIAVAKDYVSLKCSSLFSLINLFYIRTSFYASYLIIHLFFSSNYFFFSVSILIRIEPLLRVGHPPFSAIAVLMAAILGSPHTFLIPPLSRRCSDADPTLTF